MNTSLVDEQSLLLQTLFAADEAVRACLHENLASRGLQAYRANGQALAERALSAAYPVVAQMIGEQSFASLARHFWRLYPPHCGDMAEWGGDLAGFLDAAPQLADEPFLGDVARIEWALHRAGTAHDARPSLTSLALLGTDDAARVALTLSPGVAVLDSAYPVVSLVNAHLLNQPTLADAAALLQSGIAEHALVWRQGFKPHLRGSSAAEYALVRALQSGLSLDDAVGAAFEKATSKTFDFNDWLAQSVQTGLVTGAHLLS